MSDTALKKDPRLLAVLKTFLDMAGTSPRHNEKWGLHFGCPYCESVYDRVPGQPAHDESCPVMKCVSLVADWEIKL